MRHSHDRSAKYKENSLTLIGAVSMGTGVITDLVYDIRMDSFIVVFAHGFRLQLRLAATRAGQLGLAKTHWRP